MSRARPGDPRVAEVDVRDDQRPPRGLDDDVRERLVRGHGGRAVAPDALLLERTGERLAERAARSRDLGLGVSGRDLEHEVEGRVLGQQPEQVVEHGQPGGDARLARAGHVDARVHAPGLVRLTQTPGHYASMRSIRAPSERSRSSMRS